MAKPNDTRIAHASSNSNHSTDSTTDSTTASTTHRTHSTTQLPPELITLLQTLLANHASAAPAPVPPKYRRPPRIKPRRRLTVRASPTHASVPAVPQKRLCGRWLEVAGFGVDTRVRVHVAHEIVILIPEEAN